MSFLLQRSWPATFGRSIESLPAMQVLANLLFAEPWSALIFADCANYLLIVKRYGNFAHALASFALKNEKGTLPELV